MYRPSLGCSFRKSRPKLLLSFSHSCTSDASSPPGPTADLRCTAAFDARCPAASVTSTCRFRQSFHLTCAQCLHLKLSKWPGSVAQCRHRRPHAQVLCSIGMSGRRGVQHTCSQPLPSVSGTVGVSSEILSGCAAEQPAAASSSASGSSSASLAAMMVKLHLQCPPARQCVKALCCRGCIILKC